MANEPSTNLHDDEWVILIRHRDLIRGWLPQRGGWKDLTCLRRSLTIAARVSMMVLVNHGADETPSAGLREELFNCS